MLVYNYAIRRNLHVINNFKHITKFIDFQVLVSMYCHKVWPSINWIDRNQSSFPRTCNPLIGNNTLQVWGNGWIIVQSVQDGDHSMSAAKTGFWMKKLYHLADYREMRILKLLGAGVFRLVFKHVLDHLNFI